MTRAMHRTTTSRPVEVGRPAAARISASMSGGLVKRGSFGSMTWSPQGDSAGRGSSPHAARHRSSSHSPVTFFKKRTPPECARFVGEIRQAGRLRRVGPGPFGADEEPRSRRDEGAAGRRARRAGGDRRGGVVAADEVHGTSRHVADRRAGGCDRRKQSEVDADVGDEIGDQVRSRRSPVRSCPRW